jgi:hypothetical protein
MRLIAKVVCAGWQCWPCPASAQGADGFEVSAAFVGERVFSPSRQAQLGVQTKIRFHQDVRSLKIEQFSDGSLSAWSV